MSSLVTSVVFSAQLNDNKTVAGRKEIKYKRETNSLPQSSAASETLCRFPRMSLSTCTELHCRLYIFLLFCLGIYYFILGVIIIVIYPNNSVMHVCLSSVGGVLVPIATGTMCFFKPSTSTYNSYRAIEKDINGVWLDITDTMGDI